MLQKTLLYIEGLGRQLYPQLDLWQTAKPFLENWVQQQMGPAALWRELKANLPFWAEKMPEMPGLLHHYLQQGPKQQAQFIAQLQQVQAQQQHQTKKLANAVLAGCSLLAAVLLLTSGWSITAAVLALIALVFCVKS